MCATCRICTLLLILSAAAGCETVAPPSEHDAGSSAAELDVASPADEAAAPPGLPPENPDGLTVYRWEDVYAAGHLEWAWAIASDYGDLEKIDTLLADGVDPDTLIGGDYSDPAAPQYGLYRTALMDAARHGYDEVAERLLEAGADPSIHELHYGEDGKEMGRGGDTALHEAAAVGNEWLVRRLLAAGVAVDAAGFDGYTPLFYAEEDSAVVRLLLDAGADPERAAVWPPGKAPERPQVEAPDPPR